MSSVDAIKEEAEKQIRALLNSTPAGLAVGELKRDYQQFIGSPIPYQKFGYSSAEDYFNDIPDVITPVWVNGKTILKATANETTRHIEKLVSRQRVTNKSKWAALRKKSHGYASRPRYVSTPQVPVSIRQQIKQMFRQNRSLPLTHFDNLFYKTFGHHLDHESLGFSSVENLLKSIPDTVTLINQHGEWRVLSAYARYQCTRRYQNDPPKPSSTPTKSNNNDTTGIGITFASREPDHQDAEGSLSPISSPTKSIGVVACSPPASPIRSSPEPEEFEDPVHKDLKKVLSSHSKGIMASRLAFEYKAMIGKELPFKDHGYHSVIEFVNDIPNVVRIERPDPSADFILFDATAPVSPTDKRKISYANDRKVSDEIKEAIKQVLQTHPDGITMAKFPSAFYDLTGKQIDPAAMGFSSFESLLLSLTDNVLQATYKGKECVLLNARDTNEPRRYDQLLEKYHPHAEPVSPNLESLHKKCSIPEDSILPGTYYTAQKLPEVTSDYIEVFISNILSPGLFWLQLRGKRMSEALENLMDELADYYMTADSKRYKMPEYLYMIGQLCAVIFPEDNNWHRGIITGIRSMEVIEVYFVDYGNTCAVPKDTLRLLRSRFRKLPAQAIQARLANIKPIKEFWCVGGRDRLLQICTNKPLVGFLTAVRDRVLSLCLTDTSQEEDIHLNDLLVEERYAKFAPDELHPSTLGPTQFAEVPGDDLIYGFNPATVTGTASVTDNSSTVNTSPPEIPSGIRHVRFIEATPNHSFHLINIYNSPYLLSAEISALFWTNDLLSSELLKRDVSCTKIKVIRSEQQEFFQELQGYGVSSMNPDKQVISLYALEEVPKILELFDHESRELRRAICNMIQSFDIDDNYWKGIEEENKVEDEEEEFDLSARIAQELEESQLQLEELQLTLKAIEFKRKRILQEMMSHTGSSVELVNQLHEVEIQINMTTEVIEEIEKLQAGNSDEEEESDCGEGDIDGDREESENVDENIQTNVKTNRVAPLVIHPTPTKDKNEGESQQNTHDDTSNTVQERQTVPNSANTNVPQQQTLNPSALNPNALNPNAFANESQNDINYLQQQHHQQLLLQSMMTQQMDPSFSGMMSPAGPYQSMMPNPMLSQWGYFGQQMPVDPQNAMYWPNMAMASNLNMNYNEPQNNLQQMNYMRMPTMMNRMPNYTARLPAINPQNTPRLQSPCIPMVPPAQRFSIRPPLFQNTNHTLQSSLQSSLNSGDVQQANIPTDSGILPNLLPLLQNLHMGRGKPQD